MIMPTAELIAIIGTMLGVGLALAVLIMRSTARVDADRRALQVTMDAFRSESAADRRALQAAMNARPASRRYRKSAPVLEVPRADGHRRQRDARAGSTLASLPLC